MYQCYDMLYNYTDSVEISISREQWLYCYRNEIPHYAWGWSSCMMLNCYESLPLGNEE